MKRRTFLAGLLALVPLAGAGAELADTIARVKPSVVAIGTFQPTRNPAFQFRGTGFAVGDGTLVATNAHVLPESVNTAARETLVALYGASGDKPEVRELKPQATDAPHDLALLRMVGGQLPAVPLAADPPIREGGQYAFTGFPIATVLGFYPVTHRAMIASVVPIVLPAIRASQLDARAIRRITAGPFPVYQLDATAYPGNSGSPLYDPDSGEVIAIINMTFVKGTRESALSSPSGISYAIPVRHLRELLKQAER